VRHTGGLSVQSFLRSQHVIDYTRDALAEVAPLVDALGGSEDLIAHVDAVRARIPRTP
jgi:histidinol dehydrogenase